MHEYMKVRQYIVDMSHHTDADHALPSERQISEMYHVSRSTVRRALSDLVEANYLIKCPKRGYFVCNSRIDVFKGKIIGLVIKDFMSAFISDSDLCALANIYSEAGKYPVAVQSIICSNPEQLVSDIQNSTLDGILWYGVPDRMFSYYEQLVRTGIPMAAVFQGVCEPETEGDYIYLDHRKEAYAQTRYLLERGAERILFPDLPDASSFCIDGYLKAYDAFGIKPNREWIFPENFFASILPELYDRWKFDGIVCRFDEICHILDFAKQHNIAVPGDLQIITGASAFSGSATHTLKPFRKIFQLCFKLLWARMNGTFRKQMKINSLEWSIIPGTTTQDFPRS